MKLTELKRTAPERVNEMARERLKNILIRDRVDIAPMIMQQVKDEMLNVASEYFNVSQKESEIYLTGMKKKATGETETYLVCLIPVFKPGQIG